MEDMAERERLAEEMLPKIEKLVKNMTRSCPWLREEAFSAALASLVVEISRFDPSVSDNFSAFAMQSARNRVTDCLRRNAKPKNSMLPLSDFPQEIDEYDSSRSGSGHVGWEIEYEDFARSISSCLSEASRKSFESIYIYCKGEDLKGIAKSIGVSYDNLCCSHHYAMKKIRQRLGVKANA